jgi:hypothetical protein
MPPTCFFDDFSFLTEALSAALCWIDGFGAREALDAFGVFGAGLGDEDTRPRSA